MSDGSGGGRDGRAERIARYKEERKRQFASQFGNGPVPKDSSSSDQQSGGPRPTRTSRLRAAAQENTSSPQHTKSSSLNNHEKFPALSTSSQDVHSTTTAGSVGRRSSSTSANPKVERDKSSKRKSNLNRALNCEQVPEDDVGTESKSNRRRARRFLPNEVTDRLTPSTTTTSEINNTLPSQPQSSSPRLNSSRKSELSLHMENARRGVTPSYSEMGKCQKIVKSARERPSKKPTSDRESSHSDERIYNKENSTRLRSSSAKNSLDSSDIKATTKRMEELTALTKKTLAGVERLASKNRESPRINMSANKRAPSSSPVKVGALSSILKKKSLEEPTVESFHSIQNVATLPVSILKRKVSQDEKGEGGAASNTPPVTFSPSVVDPVTSNRKQGILKKRRSLDESQVMRHRSCSPDVHNNNYKVTDSRSILKNQRRSSLEDLWRTQSPEIQLHGILKRKTSRTEDEDHSLNSPQGILKRRSGASSAGSTGSGPHVSITTAVILAAAEGAEMILESDVKPILKKKSFDEHPPLDYNCHDVPKPILKKKSSTDTDDCDDRPKRPILKISRNSVDNKDFASNGDNAGSDDNNDVKSILRQLQKDDFVRPRLSFSNDNDDVVLRSQGRISRRSHTICSEFMSITTTTGRLECRGEDRDLVKARPLSVGELVKTFESSTSTGAIPKRSSLKRSSDRYRTQPVTSNELEASLNFVESASQLEVSSSHQHHHQSNLSSSSLLNFASFLDNDRHLNSFLSSSFQSSPDNSNHGISTNKMSSDSAFQSLGDGLELEQEKSPESAKSTGPGGLALQMKAIAEEAKRMRLAKSGGASSSSSRFSTQPVTFREVQEAAKLSKNKSDGSDTDGLLEDSDPAKLTLLERIRLFSSSPKHKEAIEPLIKNNEQPMRRRYMTRFQTQPVTVSEVESARFPIPDTARKSALGEVERKGILKSMKVKGSSPQPSKSAMKKRESVQKVPEIVHDEGISCNDSCSDSEIASDQPANQRASKNKAANSDTTSDGESSGGREIRSIFRNEKQQKLKLALESVLSKSKSQSVVVDEGGDSAEDKKSTGIRRSQTQAAMPRSIAERQAKLQQNGESGWMRRVQQNNNSNDELQLLKDKNKYNDQLSERSVLASRKDELDAAAQQWKSRVEKSDAEKFSVAGRMENKDGVALAINIPVDDDKTKKTPQPKKFKSKTGGGDSSSTPVSPDKSRHDYLTRTNSVPDPDKSLLSPDVTISRRLLLEGKKVQVSRPDDFTFTNFYKSAVDEKKATDHLDITLDDLDCITRPSAALLVQKKNVQVQKRRGATKNPIKALATRSDIAEEYTEIITGVAEREKKRLNIEKLAKNSNLAVEALAGLASKEDFGSVALKKSSSTCTVPFKDVMLLQVKGRFHVQTRLVAPVAESINEGDNFILIAANALYHYEGAFASVIETNRASNIVKHIQKTGDMGCKVTEVIKINAKTCDCSSSNNKQIKKFWSLLRVKEPESFTGFTDGGNPTEDEIYESNVIATNMIYKLEGQELVPWDDYWGRIPKSEMLHSTNVVVFDFGSEMYVWSGISASLEKKRLALNLAKELWSEGYDYAKCGVCPLNVASILGNRPAQDLEKVAKKRPDWALFSKITQRRETILFKEKFLDLSDADGLIKMKKSGSNDPESPPPPIEILPINVDKLVVKNDSEPDLEIDANNHLGRGRCYFNEEKNQHLEFETLEISGWRILENNSEKLPLESLAHFYEGDSYIIRWRYKVSVKGRELSGRPSKFVQSGADKSLFFLWQGAEASINEKGCAALLTVELDSEQAPQIRVAQGSEPAAFLNLFKGELVVHKGKRDDPVGKEGLYFVQGDLEEETSLIQVPCDVSQLRSRTCFVLIETEVAKVTIWNGSKSTKQKRKVTRNIVDKIVKSKASEFGLNGSGDDLTVEEIDEGDENSSFLDVINREESCYFPLIKSDLDYDFTLRLFHLSSISGEFKATESLCPHRSQHSSPYPFWQTDLYSASQPALFLLDNHHELWLWQGWWPELEEESVELQDQTGSGAIRYQSERKAAMQTALDYWRKCHPHEEQVPAYLVWAGLEPLEFKNLFPTWTDRQDVAEINLKDGRKPEAKLPVENELARLSRSTYPLAELMQRPLPEGVDPRQIEVYLSPEDFEIALSMSKDEFKKLPSWKQTAVKKENGLF